MNPNPASASEPTADSAGAGEALAKTVELLGRLQQQNEALIRRIAELEQAATHGTAARRAALNLMEDAVESRRRAESLNAELVHEIAERKRAEAALREADRRKSEFLAMLGHELRNPLAAIDAGLKVLQSEAARPESRAAALPIVAHQVQHITRLIDDVLDLARIERGKLQVRLERLLLRDVLAGAITMVEALPEAAGHPIRPSLPPHPIAINADRVRLTQVVVNLLANAVKFSPPQAPVDVATSSDARTAVVRVRDYGAGIRPEFLPHVFDPFSQSGDTLGLPDPGLGLGLAISRQLAEAHGGTLEAFSEGENRGSEFVLRLPLTLLAETASA